MIIAAGGFGLCGIPELLLRAIKRLSMNHQGISVPKYEQFEAHVAIDEASTVEGAARSLRVSSFAISQRVGQLENTVGTTLVERSGGKSRASDAGRILIDHARKVSKMEEELVASHLAGTFLDYPDATPIIRIALTEEIINGWFRSVLRDCFGPNTDSRIDVTTSNPDKSMEIMQLGEVSIGSINRV